MTPFDQTAKSITTRKREVAKGKLTPEAGEKAIEYLKKKGASWVARWRLPSGKYATKAGFKTKKQAEQYEARMAARIEAGDVAAPMNTRAKVSEICDFYLEHQIGDKTLKYNVRPHMAFAKEQIGDMRLDRIAANAHTILNTYIFTTAEKRYPNKSTLFNHFVYLRAAFRFWAKKKQLMMADPWAVVDFENPKVPRTTTMTFDDYTRCLAEAQKPENAGVHPWLPLMFVVAWEYGRRTGETHALRWEHIHLKPQGHDLPWFRIQALKQGRVVLDDLPLTADTYRVLKALWKGEKEGAVVPVHRSVVTKWVRKVMDAAGCVGMILHDSRRGFTVTRHDLTREQRMDMKGQRTESSDDWYRTEKRKGLEEMARRTYDAALIAGIEGGLMGDAEEISPQTGEIKEKSPINW